MRDKDMFLDPGDLLHRNRSERECGPPAKAKEEKGTGLLPPLACLVRDFNLWKSLGIRGTEILRFGRLFLIFLQAEPIGMEQPSPCSQEIFRGLLTLFVLLAAQGLPKQHAHPDSQQES